MESHEVGLEVGRDGRADVPPSVELSERRGEPWKGEEEEEEINIWAQSYKNTNRESHITTWNSREFLVGDERVLEIIPLKSKSC